MRTLRCLMIFILNPTSFPTPSKEEIQRGLCYSRDQFAAQQDVRGRQHNRDHSD